MGCERRHAGRVRDCRQVTLTPPPAASAPSLRVAACNRPCLPHRLAIPLLVNPGSGRATPHWPPPPTGPQVLCASNEAHDQVDPINPPEGVPVGERITFEG